eukprot:SAG11_NODE_31581_length_290_cov_2.204188_1_plen_71_part_00
MVIATKTEWNLGIGPPVCVVCPVDLFNRNFGIRYTTMVETLISDALELDFSRPKILQVPTASDPFLEMSW